MKILILTNNVNGLYLFRKELVKTLADRGDEVVVSLPPDSDYGKLEQLGCRVIPTWFERRGNNPVKDLKLFLTYWKLLKKERPDVVLTYTIKPNLYGGLACSLRKVPYIVNVTGLGTALEGEGILSKILLVFYRIAAGEASCVFFQNQTNKQFMQERGIALHQARILPGSGVNLQEHEAVEYPSEEDGIRFLAVIRIMKDKGIEEFLNAVKVIKEKYPFVSFGLAGGYEEETKSVYEPQIQALVKQRMLTYYGHSDEIHRLMGESHVIIHPSYHEGLSNVLLEAASCGRPVLASDVPGCRETLISGISGLTFVPRQSEALIRAIENILSISCEERKQMGFEGRQHMEAVFDRKFVIKAYLEEIEKTI